MQRLEVSVQQKAFLAVNWLYKMAGAKNSYSQIRIEFGNNRISVPPTTRLKAIYLSKQLFPNLRLRVMGGVIF